MDAGDDPLPRYSRNIPSCTNHAQRDIPSITCTKSKCGKVAPFIRSTEQFYMFRCQYCGKWLRLRRKSDAGQLVPMMDAICDFTDRERRRTG